MQIQIKEHADQGLHYLGHREDPDQTASLEAVWSGSTLCGSQLLFKMLENLPYVKTGMTTNHNGVITKP